VAGALDADLDLVVRWRGGDLGRLLNGRHAAMHEAMARRFAEQPGWLFEPEVSFSIYGERGVIDGLAWHAASRSALTVELKTELVDINDLMATADRRRRLARSIAADRGWSASAVSTWIVVADSRTNRRALARHATTLRAKFPDDGHRMRQWLQEPRGAVAALSFMTIEQVALDGAVVSGVSRIRHAAAARVRALGAAR
jgi:hypothetical protein